MESMRPSTLVFRLLSASLLGLVLLMAHTPMAVAKDAAPKAEKHCCRGVCRCPGHGHGACAIKPVAEPGALAFAACPVPGSANATHALAQLSKAPSRFELQAPLSLAFAVCATRAPSLSAALRLLSPPPEA